MTKAASTSTHMSSMSTQTMQRPVSPPRFALPSAVSEISATIVGLIALAPVALVAGHGWVRGIGVVYSAVWLITMIPSSAAYLAMLLDAALLASRKRPLLIPALMYAHLAGRAAERRRVSTWLGVLGDISFYVNPLAGAAGRFLRLAMDRRPEQILALTLEVADVVRDQRQAHAEVLYSSVQPQLEMSQPVLRRMEPELAVCG